MGERLNGTVALVTGASSGIRAASGAVERTVEELGRLEPGAAATELTDHLRDGVRETVRERFRGLERLAADDIADAIEYIVSRPRNAAINEILIRPTEQAW